MPTAPWLPTGGAQIRTLVYEILLLLPLLLGSPGSANKLLSLAATEVGPGDLFPKHVPAARPLCLYDAAPLTHSAPPHLFWSKSFSSFEALMLSPREFTLLWVPGSFHKPHGGLWFFGRS